MRAVLPSDASVRGALLLALVLAGAPRAAAAGPGPPEAPKTAATPAIVEPTAGEPAPAEPVRRPRFAPGKGVTVESEDRRWALRASLRAGVQATVVHPSAAGGATRAGAELRRLRVVLSGHALGEHNRYFFQLGFAPRDLGHDGDKARNTPILDAHVDFTYLRDLTVRVGQYRPQYNRERLILDINPLLIDRSLANGEFNFDRDLGLDLRSDDLLGLGLMRYYAGVFLGRGRDPRGVGAPGFLYTARVELLPLGLFDDDESADLGRERRLRASFGGAYAFHDRAQNDRGVLGTPPADGGTTDYHNATVDLLVKYAGLYLEAGLLWRRGRRHPGDAVDERGAPLPITPARSGYGWFVQASLLLPRTRLEPALRYAEVRPLGALAATSSLTPRSELGGGLNVYIHGHDLKVQVDYFRLWEARAIDAGDDQVRAQLQIAF